MAIIDKPNDLFNCVLYSGTGSEKTVAGINFSPNLTWLKSRSNGQPHMISDSVRGATKQLYPNTNSAETSYSQYIKSFNSDGFVLGTDSGINQNGQNYVSWNWKESVSSGLDIVTWTGNGSNRTIAHNLNKVPKMIIIKDLSASTDWTIYHVGLGNTKRLVLNTTNGGEDDASFFQDTTPTSSVFSVGSSSAVNLNGRSYIGYVYTNIDSYSQMGSYIGNNNSNGPFIHCGFKPAWILAKRTDASAGWVLFDNKRIGYNGSGNYWLDAQNAEVDQTDATGMFDQLSNGFKIRSSFGSRNGSGGLYVFTAFAANPFVSSSGNGSIPVTAR